MLKYKMQVQQNIIKFAIIIGKIFKKGHIFSSLFSFKNTPTNLFIHMLFNIFQILLSLKITDYIGRLLLQKKTNI